MAGQPLEHVMGIMLQDEDLLLPFAQRDGHIIHICEVTPDDRLGFRCPKCQQRLVPRLGSVRRHHFAHHTQIDCVGSTETALHLCAKEILVNRHEMMVPAKRVSYRGKPVQVADAGCIRYSGAEAERRHGSITPDVTLWQKNGDAFLVEVYYSHRVPSDKVAILREMGFPCIEVDIRDAIAGDSFDRALLEHLLVNDYRPSVKQWLCIPDIKDLLAPLREAAKQEEERRLDREAADAAEAQRQAERALAVEQAERERQQRDVVRLAEATAPTIAQPSERAPQTADKHPCANMVGPDRPQYRCFNYAPVKWQSFVYHQYIEYPRAREIDPTPVADRLIRMHAGLLRGGSGANRAEVQTALSEYFHFLVSIGVLDVIPRDSRDSPVTFAVVRRRSQASR